MKKPNTKRNQTAKKSAVKKQDEKRDENLSKDELEKVSAARIAGLTYRHGQGSESI